MLQSKVLFFSLRPHSVLKKHPGKELSSKVEIRNKKLGVARPCLTSALWPRVSDQSLDSITLSESEIRFKVGIFFLLAVSGRALCGTMGANLGRSLASF